MNLILLFELIKPIKDLSQINIDKMSCNIISDIIYLISPKNERDLNERINLIKSLFKYNLYTDDKVEQIMKNLQILEILEDEVINISQFLLYVIFYLASVLSVNFEIKRKKICLLKDYVFVNTLKVNYIVNILSLEYVNDIKEIIYLDVINDEFNNSVNLIDSDRIFKDDNVLLKYEKIKNRLLIIKDCNICNLINNYNTYEGIFKKVELFDSLTATSVINVELTEKNLKLFLTFTSHKIYDYINNGIIEHNISDVKTYRIKFNEIKICTSNKEIIILDFDMEIKTENSISNILICNYHQVMDELLK